MKKLVKKVFIFIVPLLCWFIIEGFLPPNTYTYRPWEALQFQTIFRWRKVFYPNTKIQMESAGELCHHTKNTTFKREIWITDKLGNRNDSFIEAPDILIIGDSFVAGERITQDSTITNQLQSELGAQATVYNFIPANFSLFEYYLKSNILKKPKMVIYSCGEKYLPKPVFIYTGIKANTFKFKLKIALINNSKFSGLCIFMDKFLRMYSINWIKARLSNQKGEGVPGIDGCGMYFLNGVNQTYNYEDIEPTKNALLTYKEYCDSIGIQFLFLPMPNKETVYYDFVPFKEQPDYLLVLDSILSENDIPSINTVKLYNDYRKSNNDLLYQLDDTHWNSNGIQLVAKEIAKTIDMKSLLLAQD